MRCCGFQLMSISVCKRMYISICMYASVDVCTYMTVCMFVEVGFS